MTIGIIRAREIMGDLQFLIAVVVIRENYQENRSQPFSIRDAEEATAAARRLLEQRYGPLPSTKEDTYYDPG